MKKAILIISLITGIYMIADGIYVMQNGKYIGPEKPGPWAYLFYQAQVDVFKLGPLFMVLGVLWLLWAYGLWQRERWAAMFGITVAVCTLWYIPLGTLFALIVLGAILGGRNRLGI